MARFARLDVYNAVLETGLVPLFYEADPDVAASVAAACASGGARVIEFTNRGEMAYPTFVELVRRASQRDPETIIGVGSVVDAPTAALFISAGTNFIVGQHFNREVAMLRNRRKIAYLPGCASVGEIGQAEEMGVEICKVFPGETMGPGFIKAVLGPCPWSRLMPTGGVEPTQESISAWIGAGAVAVGMGSKLITGRAVKEGDFGSIQQLVAETIKMIGEAKRKSP